MEIINQFESFETENLVASLNTAKDKALPERHVLVDFANPRILQRSESKYIMNGTMEVSSSQIEIVDNHNRSRRERKRVIPYNEL